MQFKDDILIQAPREKVWMSLNSLTSLKSCQPYVFGSKADIRPSASTEVDARFTPAQGDLCGQLAWRVQPIEINAVLRQADVRIRLTDMAETQTRLHYEVELQPHGAEAGLDDAGSLAENPSLRAQVQAVIDASLQRFKSAQEETQADTDISAAAIQAANQAVLDRGLPAWMWVSGLVLLTLATVFGLLA